MTLKQKQQRIKVLEKEIHIAKEVLYRYLHEQAPIERKMREDIYLREEERYNLMREVNKKQKPY